MQEADEEDFDGDEDEDEVRLILPSYVCMYVCMILNGNVSV